MRNRKFLFKAFIIFILLIISYFIFFTLYNNSNNNSNEEEWNKVDNSPKYDSDSLYDSTNVISLDKLFKNSNFITQVKTNRLSYLYGFNSDGNYLASINYDDKIKGGYILNINNIITDENVFSIFIPDNEFILDSKEFAFAKELVESAYEITIPPNKLDWNNIFIYETEQGLWYFSEETNEENVIFTISTSKNDDVWKILLDDQSSSLVYTEVFASSKETEWLTFVFYFDQFQTGISNYKTITIDLNKLTNNNSEEGKVKEADRWLYGEFAFIYDQWNKYNKKGFLAISLDDKNTLEKEDLFYRQVDQWIYMDMTGKMQWYGNSEGIYNSIGEPIEQAKSSYYYDLNLIEYYNRGLTYYVVDIFDNTNNSFVKTIEYIWDGNQQYMVPIQYENINLESNN